MNQYFMNGRIKALRQIENKNPIPEENMDIIDGIDGMSELKKRFPELSIMDLMKLHRRIREKRLGSTGYVQPGEKIGKPKDWYSAKEKASGKRF